MVKRILIMFACIGLTIAQLQCSIAELRIKIKGMVCPFCSSSLDLALKQRPYIKQVKKIDFANGVAEILIKKNTKHTLDEMKADLEKTVKEAAFTFDGIEKVIEK